MTHIFPIEVWRHIVSFLTLADHLVLQRVNHVFHSISRTPQSFNTHLNSSINDPDSLNTFVDDLLKDIHLNHDITSRARPRPKPLPTYLPHSTLIIVEVLPPLRTTHKFLFSLGPPASQPGPLWRLQFLLIITVKDPHDSHRPQRLDLGLRFNLCRYLPTDTVETQLHQMFFRPIGPLKTSAHPCSCDDPALLLSLSSDVILGVRPLLRQDPHTTHLSTHRYRPHIARLPSPSFLELDQGTCPRDGPHRKELRRAEVAFEAGKCVRMATKKGHCGIEESRHTIKRVDKWKSVEWIEADWEVNKVKVTEGKARRWLKHLIQLMVELGKESEELAAHLVEEHM